MKFDPQSHHRRSIRLRGYDYTQQGAYFVTIVTQARECLFGEITDAEMQLNREGRLVAECWAQLPRHFRHVELDTFVLMPNHLHGILVFAWDAIDWRRGEALTFADVASDADVPVNASPLPRESPHQMPRGTHARSLNAVIQNFKSVSTRKLNQLRDAQGAKIWQRNYYEHIVRDERDLERIRAYILNNPAAWSDDDENPARVNMNRRASHS